MKDWGTPPPEEFDIPAPVNLQEIVENDKADLKILYTMPESAGDVLLSTAVVEGIAEKYPGSHIYFAAGDPYWDILKDNPHIHRVIPYSDVLLDYVKMAELFDIPFTPHFYTQKYGNWVLNGRGRHLAEVYANACDVSLGRPRIACEKPDEWGDIQECIQEKMTSEGATTARGEIPYAVVHASGKQFPKVYQMWGDIIPHISLPILQVGGRDDRFLNGVIPVLGTNANQLAYIMSKAALFLGTDSFPGHVAAVFDIPSVLLYGSTYPTLTKPLFNSHVPKIFLEPSNRYQCKRPCHLLECHQNKQVPCVNNIEKRAVVSAVKSVASTIGYADTVMEKLDHAISAYGIILNGFEQELPFQAAIDSHVDMADEVVVLDGGSEDGTWEHLQERYGSNPKVKLVQSEWDFSQPTMFGIQKTKARRECTGDWLWQFDMDEVIHEKDIPKIREVIESRPGEDMFTFGCITFFDGDDAMDITGENPIKWRLTKNLPWLSHGVVDWARKYTEDGTLYMDKRDSDACEYIREEDGALASTLIRDNLVLNPGLVHFRDVVQKAWKEGNSIDYRGQYQFFVNEMLDNVPCVYHYSWINIERKIKRQTPFWDRMWLNYSGDGKPQTNSRWVKDKGKDEVTEEDLQKVVTDFRSKPVIALHDISHPKYVKEWLEEHNPGRRCNYEFDGAEAEEEAYSIC